LYHGEYSVTSSGPQAGGGSRVVEKEGTNSDFSRELKERGFVDTGQRASSYGNNVGLKKRLQKREGALIYQKVK
jgi:hypothetical protein